MNIILGWQIFKLLKGGYNAVTKAQKVKDIPDDGKPTEELTKLGVTEELIALAKSKLPEEPTLKELINKLRHLLVYQYVYPLLDTFGWKPAEVDKTIAFLKIIYKKLRFHYKRRKK